MTKPKPNLYPLLIEETIIRIFCIIDDSLKAMNPRRDIGARVSDSEVLSELFLGGHLEHVCTFIYLCGISTKYRLRAFKVRFSESFGDYMGNVSPQ